MPDSTAIDQALMALLGSDATLLGYMPNGVYWDEAPQNMTRFVIVSLEDSSDAQTFGGRSYEDAVYVVVARGRSDLSPNMQAAAARIDALLDGATLAAAGYTSMLLQREGRVRQTEVDEVDASIRWHHRGGRYRVVMST